MSLESLYEKPAHLIRRAHQISWAIFLDECAEFGLTPVQYAALTAIGSSGQTDATRLSGMIAFDRSTIGSVLDRLEKRGLIRRIPSPTDRRQKFLELTPEGTQILAASEEAVMRVQNRLLGMLGREEREVFLRILSKVVSTNNEVTSAPLKSPSA